MQIFGLWPFQAERSVDVEALRQECSWLLGLVSMGVEQNEWGKGDGGGTRAGEWSM